jgi:tetratricopeptide (TPR) repeat protein/predicted Ser/Thr protein kinase
VAPTAVGPYRVLRKLGSGGMGEVYLAEDGRLRRKVALKSLARASGSEGRRRLLREARAAAALNHPNIAAVYDVVESADGDFIVMEYVPGENLADRLGQGPISPSTVVWIGAQICDALAEAHAQGIVHRDLKPGNVVLTPAGRVKVLDFGLARAIVQEPSDLSDSLDAPEVPGRLVGTAPYMPPEPLQGRPIDERGDIYSLGVTLYELATGRRPFHGPDAASLRRAILCDPPAPVPVECAIPASLAELIGRAMARDPEARPRSAGALKAELVRARNEMAASGAPTEEQWWTSSGRATPRRRRALLAWAVAAVLAVALAAGGLLYWRSRPRVDAGRPPVVAVLPLDAAGDASTEPLGAGAADLLVATLARVPGVNVLSRGATAPYRGRAKGTGRIAKELGADFVVDGTIQRAAGKVRVTYSLVRAGSEVVVWGDAREGALDDVLQLQRDAAEAVVDALRVRIPARDRERMLGASTSSPDAFAEFAEARSYLERFDVAGNADRAIVLFHKAIARDPSFALARAGLGEALWRKYSETHEAEWAAKARAAVDGALALDPDQPGVRYSLALVYMRTGERAKAVDEFRRVIALQPSSDEAYNHLGDLLVETGQVDEGLRRLNEAIRLRPGYWSNHYSLGVALFQLGRLAGALAAFRRVVELQPDNSWGYQMLGTTLLAQGDRRGAIEAFRESIRVGPNAGAWSNLGTAYYAEGRFEEALAAYRECARLEPNAPLAHRNAGDALARLDRRAEARDEYARAVDLAEAQLRVNPEDASVRAELAVYLAKAGRPAEAWREAQRAVRLAPASADVAYQQAVVATLSNRLDEGQRALQLALDRGYSPAFVEQDDDLLPLRARPEVRSLLRARAETKKKEEAR